MMIDSHAPCPAELTLRELFAIVQERSVAAEQRFAAQEKATTIALHTLEKRLDGVNEFRASLADQAQTLMPRKEYEVQHKALADQIIVMRDRMVAMEQIVVTWKEGLGMTGAILLGTFAVLSSLAALVTLLLHMRT
jgi:hypothetical protein